ncbi:hypothetical protein AB0436_22355 [Streptomyces sp. NPDC051322]|uniref:hypothetical protein n=1 Tax=Streptomyces sp. NPDC051322 TaxID=3154645 RepID=UPI00344CCF30
MGALVVVAMALTMNRFQNHGEHQFGDLKTGKLTAEMLELFYARLRQRQDQCEGRRNGKTDPTTKQKHVCEPLAANSTRQIHFVLRRALNRGLRWGYVTTNVAALAEPLRTRPEPRTSGPTPCARDVYPCASLE